jgi:hypothetical protein
MSTSIEPMKKILALARCDVGGEQATSQAMPDKLLKKWGMKLADLDDQVHPIARDGFEDASVSLKHEISIVKVSPDIILPECFGHLIDSTNCTLNRVAQTCCVTLPDLGRELVLLKVGVGIQSDFGVRTKVFKFEARTDEQADNLVLNGYESQGVFDRKIVRIESDSEADEQSLIFLTTFAHQYIEEALCHAQRPSSSREPMTHTGPMKMGASALFVFPTSCLGRGEVDSSDQCCDRPDCADPLWPFLTERQGEQYVKHSANAQQGKDRQEDSSNEPVHMLFHISSRKYCEKLNTTPKGTFL